MDETQLERGKRLTKTKEPWQKWEESGQQCYFVSFHDPVPAGRDKEPVGEFRLETKDKKYQVDKIVYSPFGLIFWAHGQMGVVGLANVKLVRFYNS